MTFKDPYSELYEALFVTLEQTGYETYGHLPDDDASYPFVFLGEQWSKDRQTKTRTLGSTNIMIHVYDHDDKRRELNQVLADVRKIVHELHQTKNFNWLVTESSTEVIYENTTNFVTSLAHGVLDITLEFE